MPFARSLRAIIGLSCLAAAGCHTPADIPSSVPRVPLDPAAPGRVAVETYLDCDVERRMHYGTPCPDSARIEQDAGLIRLESIGFLDREFRCNDYVFSTKMNEPWCAEGDCSERQLFSASFGTFLRTHGYEFVQSPAPGDIAVYLGTKGTLFTEEAPRHWGYVEKDGIASKFGGHDAYLHRLERVPPSYGTQAVFMRKTRAGR